MLHEERRYPAEEIVAGAALPSRGAGLGTSNEMRGFFAPLRMTGIISSTGILKMLYVYGGTKVPPFQNNHSTIVLDRF